MITIDLAHDTLVEVRRVPELLPRNARGKKIALATIYRWMSRDELPVIRVGGRQYTSIEALQAWAERRTKSGRIAPPFTPRLRQRSIERAAAEAQEILRAPRHADADSTDEPARFIKKNKPNKISPASSGGQEATRHGSL